MKTLYTKGVRPDETPDGRPIPPDWLIFNAPRPLHATPIEVEGQYPDDYLHWQGDFRHGIFYVAVDPKDEQNIQGNVSLDGWVLRYVTDEEIVAWAVGFYNEQYPDDPEIAEKIRAGEEEYLEMAQRNYFEEHNYK